MARLLHLIRTLRLVWASIAILALGPVLAWGYVDNYAVPEPSTILGLATVFLAGPILMRRRWNSSPKL